MTHERYFWNQMFLLQQVKWKMIITNKNGI